MPQNEPSVSSNYTSCRWTGEQLAAFIGHHLGPTLEQGDRSTPDIYLGTINDSGRGGYAYWVAPVHAGPAGPQYIAGVGCQWAGDTTMAETHFLQPDLQAHAIGGRVRQAQHQRLGLWRKTIRAGEEMVRAPGASCNIIWNLVLDETGLSTANWPQCSPVVVDSHDRKVIYTPYFYCYKHFSHFVQPGAHVVATESTGATGWPS